MRKVIESVGVAAIVAVLAGMLWYKALYLAGILVTLDIILNLIYGQEKDKPVPQPPDMGEGKIDDQTTKVEEL
jgi:hypothetical protein